jgi:elongation factor G
MHEEDPTWIIQYSKELKQTIVHGQGEFHLKTLKWRIENNDKIQIAYTNPRIPYRETITKTAKADYRHKKQSGGAGQFGEVHLIIEPYFEGVPEKDTYKINGQEIKISVRDKQEYPLEWGGKLVFINSIVGGVIDTRFLPAIPKRRDGLYGARSANRFVCTRYTSNCVRWQNAPSRFKRNSFRLAGKYAFSEAFKNAGPKVLEPIYDVEVLVPGASMGDVMSDLQGRRAMIMGMESDKGMEKIFAKVPLKEMNNYSIALSSNTRGRASFSMKFASYELLPSDVQDTLLKEYEKSKVAD